MGADFDRAPDGLLSRTREGGHSVRRIIHAGGDATGAVIQRALGSRVTELTSHSPTPARSLRCSTRPSPPT